MKQRWNKNETKKNYFRDSLSIIIPSAIIRIITGIQGAFPKLPNSQTKAITNKITAKVGNFFPAIITF